MKRIIVYIVLSVSISSCGLYKNYTRPQLNTDNLYGEEYATSDTTNFGNLAWQQVFTDPYLQTLIETGLKNNSDLEIARLKIIESQASLKAAKLSYLPSLELSPQGTVSSFDGAKASKSYELPISASWEIDIFGKQTNIKKQEMAALQKSFAYKQSVKSQLIANIANAYYTLLMLDQQLEISRQTLRSWEENIKTNKALKAAGQATQAGVSQAEAEKTGVELSIFDLELQIRQTENTICSLVAQYPQTIARGTLDKQTLPETLATGIPLQMLSNRPDVLQAEASLKQAFYYTNEARSYFYPSLTLSGSAGWTNMVGATVTDIGGLLWQVVGSISQPIFNRGQNTARLKKAKAAEQQALITFQQTLLEAGIEVNNYLTTYQNTRKKVDGYESQIKQLETALKSTKLLMQHGTTTYLEVLTAQQSLLSAQLNQVSNRFDEIQSVINLYQALGGGRSE